MPISDESLYAEIGRAWLYFDSWREKIFAGYLSVLAALAFAFTKNASVPIRATVFAFAILVSVVFWILDFRTTELINLCQAAGESLAESKGFYGELNRRRFAKKHRVSFGFAITLLVSGVVATSAVGLLIYMLRWRRGTGDVSIWWSISGVVFACAVLAFLHKYADQRWSEEQKSYRKRLSKPGSGRSGNDDPS